MKVGDKVFVIDWGKMYSSFYRYVDGEKQSVFNWKTEIPAYSDISFHWHHEYEPNLTLKGTVNKRDPKKLKSKTPVYKDYKYEILEMMVHPTYPEVNLCLIASTHVKETWRKCFVQIDEQGLSFITAEQFADETFNALKEFHKGKWNINSNHKLFPEELLQIVYDVDDNVLFGSRYVKGKVMYKYIPKEYAVDNIPIIVGTTVSYDGKGNQDLPKDALLMYWKELSGMFSNNKFSY